MSKPFFIESRNAYAKVTELLTLINAATFSVSRFQQSHDDDNMRSNEFDSKELNKYTPHQLKSFFCKILLVNACAIYEGWLDDFSHRFKLGNKFKIQLQYPDTIVDEIEDVKSKKAFTDDLAKEAFGSLYMQYLKSKRINKNLLRNRIICYRYFKESRNCYIHGDGRVNEKLIQAQSHYLRLTEEDIGFEKLPEIRCCHLGDEVEITSHGVRGLLGVIQSIILTCDCEFVNTRMGEAQFLKRWGKEVARHGLKVGKAKSEITRCINRCFYDILHLNKPPKMQAMIRYLESKRRIVY